MFLMIVNVMNALERGNIRKIHSKCIKVLRGEKVHIHSYPDKKRADSVYIHAQTLQRQFSFAKNGSAGEKTTSWQKRDNLEPPSSLPVSVTSH